MFLKFAILLALTQVAPSSARDIGRTEIDHLRDQFLTLEEQLWNYVLDTVDNGVKEQGKPELYIIKEFEKFSEEINKLWPHDITYGLEHLDSVWSYQVVYADLRNIYALFEAFKRFQIQQTSPGRVPAPKQAWLDLTDDILKGQHDIPNALLNIHKAIQKNLFNDVRKEVDSEICNFGESPQQVLYKLYQSVALTEIKGYSMIQFSYMLLKLYGAGNFTKEIQIVKDRYEERTNAAIVTIKESMKNASRNLWKCDPKTHTAGQTYEEITKLIQGYLQNEVDLNDKGECWGNCAAYSYTRSHGCYDTKFCGKQPLCNGKILHCKFVDSDMTVCKSGSSNRRYESIQYENGRTLGRNMGCSNGKYSVDSWWRYLFWHCSYCFCLCDDQGASSDRYINMRPTIANISHNYVITGLRFVKKNRVIHLQIQEGKLLPYGNIDAKTVRWVPVDDYKITNPKVFSGRDFHTLTWETRAIDLDDLHANTSHLVTGIRFKPIGTHLNFEIYTTPFDFEAGQLVEPLQKSGWKDNPNTDSSLKNPRSRVNLINPDVSTRSPLPSIPDSKHDQYIEFRETDMDKDASQTTVPFLDAQPVESVSPTPLSGVGIYHKGRGGFGGFIAPKIITYDYTEHMEVPFPPSVDDLLVN